MSADTDFLRLYRALGVEPGCGLLAFKQAYRRRVGELHPDRMGSDPHYSDGLTELNLYYTAALGFHRLHGRLPGARPQAAAAPTSLSLIRGGPPVSALAPALHRALPSLQRPLPLVPARPQNSPRPPSRRGRTNRWVVAAFGLAAVAVVWQLLPQLKEEPEHATTLAAAGDQAGSPVPLPGSLELGMEAARAIELLGQPISGADDDGHWLYGPSWVRFECGRVADWYSSPLHPLRVANARPAAAGGMTSTLVGDIVEPVRRRTGCMPGLRRDASPLVAPPTDGATASQHRGSA